MQGTPNAGKAADALRVIDHFLHNFFQPDLIVPFAKIRDSLLAPLFENSTKSSSYSPTNTSLLILARATPSELRERPLVDERAVANRARSASHARIARAYIEHLVSQRRPWHHRGETNREPDATARTNTRVSVSDA